MSLTASFPAESDQTWRELKTLLSKRIADGLAGKVSSRSVADIVNEEGAGST